MVEQMVPVPSGRHSLRPPTHAPVPHTSSTSKPSSVTPSQSLSMPSQTSAPLASAEPPGMVSHRVPAPLGWHSLAPPAHAPTPQASPTS